MGVVKKKIKVIDKNFSASNLDLETSYEDQINKVFLLKAMLSVSLKICNTDKKEVSREWVNVLIN